MLIIAELANGHCGLLENAYKLVDAAKASGADAVKFQLHIAEAESLKTAPPPPYFNKENPYKFFQRTQFTLKEWAELKEYVTKSGMKFICSPFSIEAVDALSDIGVDIYKIASGEVTNIPMLKHISKKFKPVILSSGMSNLSELDKAVVALYDTDLTILQCSSEYPCPYNHVGLNLIPTLASRYNFPVGLSDHTPTIYTALAAVTLGATVIEKHFTLDNELYDPDASFALTPDKFKEMVDGIHIIQEALEPMNKDNIERFKRMKAIFQKSLVSNVDIPEHTILTREMIGIKKPGDGLHPEYLDEIIGKKTRNFIPCDSALHAEDIVWKS